MPTLMEQSDSRRIRFYRFNRLHYEYKCVVLLYVLTLSGGVWLGSFLQRSIRVASFGHGADTDHSLCAARGSVIEHRQPPAMFSLRSPARLLSCQVTQLVSDDAAGVRWHNWRPRTGGNYRSLSATWLPSFSVTAVPVVVIGIPTCCKWGDGHGARSPLTEGPKPSRGLSANGP